MQLGDDNPLGTIDDESTVLGHQGDLPHVNILLLDIFDRLRGGFLVINNQSDFNAQRAGIGGAAQHTFVNVKHGLTQRVINIFQRRVAAIADNREYRFKRCVQTVLSTILQRDAVLSKLAV